MIALTRRAVLILLLLAAHADAGPPPLPTDAFPSFVNVETAGKDLILAGQYRITNGDWATWSGPSIDNKKYVESRYPQRRLPCTLPQKVLSEHTSPISRVKPLLCDTNRVWFASASYCSEGEDIQGYLYAYDAMTGEVENYTDFIPRCEAFAGMARVGNRLWAASIRPGEYGPYAGSGVLVFDLKTQRRLETIPATTFTDPVFHAMAHQPEADALWVTTRSGIDRFTFKTGKWERRYFDFEVTADNKLRLILSERHPGESRQWLAYHMRFYPIEDLKSFSRTWQAIHWNSDRPLVYLPFRHPGLLPYYISALRNMDREWNDYLFEHLLKHIGEYTEDAETVRALLRELGKQPLSSIRRTVVVELSQKFGLPGAGEEMDRHFEMLKERFFTQGVGSRELCEYAFRHKVYLTRLNDYYMQHTPTGNINAAFLDGCVRAYSGWPGAEAFIPAILKALQGDHPHSLAAMCSIFNHYAPAHFRLPGAVIPVLRARKKLEPWHAYSANGWYRVCIPASYWVANSREGIDALLDNIEQHPELTALAHDVLQELTGQSFAAVAEWRTWWHSACGSFQPNQKVYYWRGAY